MKASPVRDINQNNFPDPLSINYNNISENNKRYNGIYVTDDPLLYSDDNYSKMKLVGMEYNEGGYIKEWDLGNTAEIIPRLNTGNVTQYKCDYHWISNLSGLKALFLGGLADDAGIAGLGYFGSGRNVNIALTLLGFRSSCIVD